MRNGVDTEADSALGMFITVGDISTWGSEHGDQTCRQNTQAHKIILKQLKELITIIIINSSSNSAFLKLLLTTM